MSLWEVLEILGPIFSVGWIAYNRIDKKFKNQDNTIEKRFDKIDNAFHTLKTNELKHIRNDIRENRQDIKKLLSKCADKIDLPLTTENFLS